MTQPSDYSAPQHEDSGASDAPVTENFGSEQRVNEPVLAQGGYENSFETAGSEHESSSPKADAAKDQAGAMKDSAKESGHKVAGTAKEQASQVGDEAGNQAKQMVQSGLSEASDQLGTQQKRLAGGLQSYVDELGSMVANSEKSGPITDLAQQAADKGGQLAQRLEHSEPSELLDEVRAFARRRPVAFLGIAALTGVVVGRLTRGMAADAKSSDRGAASQGSSNQGSSNQGSSNQGYADQGSRFRGDSQSGTSDTPSGYEQSGNGDVL